MVQQSRCLLCLLHHPAAEPGVPFALSRGTARAGAALKEGSHPPRLPLVVPPGWFPRPGAFFHPGGVRQHEGADSGHHSRDGSATTLPDGVLHQGRGAAPGTGTPRGRAGPVTAPGGKWVLVKS